MSPLLAVSDAVLTGLIVAVTGAITTLAAAWMSMRSTIIKVEQDRKLADEVRSKETIAVAQVLADRADALRKSLEAKAVIDDHKIDALTVKLNATHDIVNSRIDEFKNMLKLQSEKTLLDFKEMLAKAAAFDNATVASASTTAHKQAALPADIKIVNTTADPANVNQVKP